MGVQARMEAMAKKWKGVDRSKRIKPTGPNRVRMEVCEQEKKCLGWMTFGFLACRTEWM